MMAKQAGRAEKVEHVNHEKWMEDRCGEFYMAKVTGTRIIARMTRFAPIEGRIPFPMGERLSLTT